MIKKAKQIGIINIMDIGDNTIEFISFNDLWELKQTFNNDVGYEFPRSFIDIEIYHEPHKLLMVPSNYLNFGKGSMIEDDILIMFNGWMFPINNDTFNTHFKEVK